MWSIKKECLRRVFMNKRKIITLVASILLGIFVATMAESCLTLTTATPTEKGKDKDKKDKKDKKEKDKGKGHDKAKGKN